MSSAPRTTRRPFTRVAALLVAGSALISACSGDLLTQPDATPRNFKLSTQQLTSLIDVTALTRDEAVPEGLVRSFTFTRKGGRIEIPETGLRVDVPEGAIPGATLTIVVTALPGTAVAYDFQPHGTVFLKPLSFRQDLDNTSWDHLGFKGTLMGGYFKDASQIDLAHGVARLDELFPLVLGSSRISFDIKHFSGYMVSTGRSFHEEMMF